MKDYQASNLSRGSLQALYYSVLFLSVLGGRFEFYTQIVYLGSCFLAIKLCSIVSINSSNFKVEFSINLVLVPLQSIKPLIPYIDSIDYSNPYIVFFAFKANGGNRPHQIYIDKLKRPYSLFLGRFIILLFGFKLSIV